MVQLQSLNTLPRATLDSIYKAFCAAHLPALANALRAVDPKTQPIALANFVEILSLLPDPRANPYFRRFLFNKTLVADIPTIVTTAFVEGIPWKQPSGLGTICLLLKNLLLWGDSALGDDRRTCLNADLRKRLFVKVSGIKRTAANNPALEASQREHIIRLDELLCMLDAGRCRTGGLLNSSRRGPARSLWGDFCVTCNGEAKLTCSTCKVAKYCGEACQKQDWKAGHKYGCFKVSF